MKRDVTRRGGEAGFSLLELMIAMGMTVMVLGLASALIASAVNVRAREDRRTDALSDVRRTLNTMTREIGNAGYGLPAGMPGNGIVAANSNSGQIRVLSNPDRFNTAPGATPAGPYGPDEDVIYRFVDDPANDQSYILRFDVNSVITQTTVLANRVDSMAIHYFDRRVTYQPGGCAVAGGVATGDITNVLNSSGLAQTEVAPAQAKYLVISACVSLPQIGSAGSPGFQPASRTQLISDVQLRNAQADSY
jgi:type II secretory pathway pseudopilin PulG